ncbi:MAG: T9SS C-terminal target domain-containing protein [Candidatus Zixiibacteriota bacterium]|nr:MAG: T9SS C-terminal target domain-containing protein [candidate division Zixibacteria bacterium]
MRYGFSLVLVVLITAVAGAFWSGTVQDQIISLDDNFMGWYTRLAVDGDGVIHAVWNERVSNLPAVQEIHYSRSADNGYTWSAQNQDLIISFPDDITAENGPGIAVNSLDYLYVVWAEKDPTIREIHYSVSLNGGNTWTGQTGDHTLSLPGGAEAYEPCIVADGNDVLHVIWRQDAPSGLDEIHYSRSTDGGLTWSSQAAETIISFPDGAGVLYGNLAVGPDNALYAVWKEADDSVTTHAEVCVSVSTNGGLTWSGQTADHPVTVPFRAIIDCRVAVDANNVVHVTWKGTQDLASPFHYEVYHSRSADGGLTWSGLAGEQAISYRAPDDPSVNNPNLGADHQGNVICVWDEDDTTGNNEIHVSVSTDGGQTWSGQTQDEIISFPDGHPAYRPFVAAGLDDTLHVTWNEVTNTSYYQIHYSRGDALGGGGSPFPDVSLTLTPENPPITIPAGGGSFNFTGALVNLETVAVTFDAWIMVHLPAGGWYGPVLGPLNLTLPGGADISRLRVQNVPAVAPAGNYIYEGRVGAYPDTLWDYDSFTFMKSAADGSGPKTAEGWACTGDPFPGELGGPGSVMAVPETFALFAFPNPFNPTTAIGYRLPASGYVTLRIYDTAGREVAVLVNGWRDAGVYEVTFDGTGLASGVYLARIEGTKAVLGPGDFSAVRKMVLLK